ncbi:MAG TPA: tetratricopeptide repeat protein [Drouetiella sp.]|jgi:tetratricopeptide (TPR) repeat protein
MNHKKFRTPKQHKILAVLLTILLGVTAKSAFAQGYMMDGKPISAKEAQAANLVKDSMQTLESGNVKSALKLAQDAVELSPDFYYAVSALGVCQARSGLSDDAISSFRKALTLNPDQPDSLWSLAATLQSAGRTDEALNSFKEFLAKYPTNARAAQAKAFIDLMGSGHSHPVTSHNPDNYFDEAIGNNPIRWAKDSMPIKIYISDGSKARGYKSSYANQLQDALKAWEDASNGLVKFAQVNSPDQASIVFVWSDNPKDVSNPAEGGEALLRPMGNTMAAVKITVLTIDIDQGMHLNDQLIRLICTHELGHALGIAGHSPSPSDIMYSSLPLDYERLKISDRDARTLRKLYTIDLASIPHASINAQGLLSTSDVANSSDLVAITQRATDAMNSKDYDKAAEVLQAGVAKYPDSVSLKHNLGAALNNKGLMAMNARQFGKALSTFQEALALNPNSNAAKHNIATVHYNMGLNSMRAAKFSEAEPELKLAIEKCEELNYQELLIKAASEYATALERLGKTAAAKQVEAKYKVTAN